MPQTPSIPPNLATSHHSLPDLVGDTDGQVHSLQGATTACHLDDLLGSSGATWYLTTTDAEAAGLCLHCCVSVA
jgi:hypothetical protein